MKLIFEKDDQSQISVHQLVDGEKRDFSYVEMIKNLIKTKTLEEADIAEGFSEAEKNSINSMVKFINESIPIKSEQSENN